MPRRQIVDVSLVPNNEATIQPGEVVTYSHTLTNEGDEPEIFDLFVDAPADWGASLAPSGQVFLSAGESIVLTLTLTAPSNTGGLVSTATVSAVSQTDPGVTATVADTTTVEEIIEGPAIAPAVATAIAVTAWVWNAALAKYQWTEEPAHLLPQATVAEYITQSIVQAKAISQLMAQMVSGGTITPPQWEAQFREELKREYIRQYILGRGGLDKMTAADWGSIGGMLAEQYSYLSGFADALPGLSEAQIEARSAMYFNSAREAYSRANWRSQIEAGMDEVLWVLDPQCENCLGCIDFANMGWQKMADDPYGSCFPGSGCTPCLTNCCCVQEFRSSEERSRNLDDRVADVVMAVLDRIYEFVTGSK